MLKVNNDLLLLLILIVRLGLDPDVHQHNRWHREPETRSVHLGQTSAYTQAIFHAPFLDRQYPHPKSLEYNELDEAAILFNRLHYFNTIRSRRADVIACVAGSPSSDSGIGSPDCSSLDGSGGVAVADHPQQSGPAPDSIGPSESEPDLYLDAAQLSREDMDLIEILWKQDIDIGVSRDAYDSRQSLDFEKFKELEFSDEKKIYKTNGEVSEEASTAPDPFAGQNYTIDSETGEYLLEDLSELSDAEIPDDRLLESNVDFLEAQLLKENETLDAVARDSYLPFDENDEFCDLSEVFSPSQFEHMLPEELLDSDYLSQIEDLEKELVGFGTLENENGTNTTTGEMYPSMEDCWPDTTTMLPLLTIGSTHQTTYPPLSPRPIHGYTNLDNSNIPFPIVPQSRPSESFLSMLQGTSLEVPPDEEFHSISSAVGPSSIGCAVAESMATLTNDTDPLPPSNIINTIYSSDFPELLYTNHTPTVPPNEMLMSDLLLDEDLQLVSLPTDIPKETKFEEHMDTSSDSISITSGQIPSVSDYDNESRSFGEDPYEQENCNEQQYFTLKPFYSDPSENSACGVTGSKMNIRKFDFDSPKANSASSSNFLHHNHTYHLPFANEDSRYKPLMRDKSRNSSDDDASNKDEKKAKELKLPISIDDIINLAIDEYNERLSKYELTEAQLTLIRDIRRRGKNKVAAQNCRKRKMDQISHLQQDLNYLQRERMQLKSKQSHLLKQKNLYQDKYSQLYNLILQSTNSTPPNPPRNNSAHRNRLALPNNSDVLISEEDVDPSRGARAKRKFKK